jgi:RNA polymerase sigma-70 factor (ECF subfamily)
MADPTPEQLFARFRRDGDAQAFAAFYDATVEEVLGTALRLGRGPAEAEDLVQATYVAAIEVASRYDPSRRVVPWLVGICAHQASKARRRATRVVDARRLRASRPVDPIDEAERNELRAELARTIDGLPAVYRPVLVLSLGHELTPAEIGRALGRPPATVRSQLYRGLELLREALPKGLALGALAWLLPTRGLAAVRAAVTSHAAAAGGGTALAAGVTVAGVLVMKKTLACAALAAVAALAWVAWPEAGSGAEEHAERAAAAGPARSAASAPGPVATAPQRVPVAEPEPGAAPRLGGARLLLVWAGDGTPAAGVRGFARELARPNPRAHGREITSDAFGRVSLADLWPGVLRLALDRCDLGVHVPPGEVVEKTLRIPAGLHVTVRVVDERKVPIPGVEVWLSDGASITDGCVAGSTGPDGVLELRDVEPERQVGARAAGFQPAITDRIQGQPGDRTRAELVLRAGGASLRGIVRLPSGQPCAGALVRIEGRSCSQTDALGIVLPPPAAVLLATDGAGTFAATGIAIGAVDVGARAVGFGGVTRQVSLRAGEAGTVELSLVEAVVLRGTVRDDLGKPLAARIHAWADRDDSFSRCEAESAPDGTFRLEDVPAGSIKLSAWCGAAAGGVTRELVVAPSPAPPIELVIVTARADEQVAGILVDGAEAPVAGWGIGVGPERGWQGTFTRTDAQGRFRVERCPAGPLEVTVHGRVGSPSFPLQTVAGVVRGTRDLRLVVPDAARAFGKAVVRATDEAGAAPARIELLVDRPGDPRSRAELAGADGRAEIAELPPGEYRFRLRDAEHGIVRLGRHRVAGGETLDLGAVTLAPAVRLEARVLGVDGARARGAEARVYDADGDDVVGDAAGDASRDLKLGPLAPGEYVALVEAHGLARKRIAFTVAAHAWPRLEWTLERGITGTITLLGRSPSTEATLTVRDPQGRELLRRSNVVFAPQASEQVSVCLAPGTYELAAREATGRAARGSLTVPAAAGSPFAAELELR